MGEKNFSREDIQTKTGGVSIVTIRTNEQNSFTYENLLEFQDILAGLQAQADVRAVVLASDNEKFFSNGVDAESISTASPERLPTEMGQIVQFFNFLVRFSKPLLAEVSGYAMGGGAVVTLASDFKYMLEGKARISFTEVLFGLPLPGVFIEKLKLTVLPQHLNETIYGALYRAQEAQAVGLIDGTAATREELRSLTLRKAEAVLRVPSSAFAGTKQSLHRGLLEKTEAHMRDLAANFEIPEVRKNLLEAMRALQEKRRPVFV